MKNGFFLVFFVVGLGIASLLIGVFSNEISVPVWQKFLIGVGGFIVLIFIVSIFINSFGRDDMGPAGPITPHYKILNNGDDANGLPFLIVESKSSHDALKAVEGWTYPGAFSWVCRKLGKDEYRLSLVRDDTEFEE